jgi:fatty acid desaturase
MDKNPEKERSPAAELKAVVLPKKERRTVKRSRLFAGILLLVVAGLVFLFLHTDFSLWLAACLTATGLALLRVSTRR